MNTTVLPKLSLLSPEQIDFVHQHVLKILAVTGVRVDSPGVLQFLEKKLGNGQVQGDRVTFPAEVVAWAIQAAPGVVEIYRRNGEPAFRLGDDRMRFGIGVTSLYYQDPLTDALSPFTRQNMAMMARLGESLRYFDCISTVGILQDVPAEIQDLYATLEMVANTTKPLVILISQEERFGDVLDLLEALTGDLAHQPFVVPYFNPVTPLVYNQGTVEKMQVAIQRGLPLIVSNYSLAGMTTPLTPAGILALMLAELLAGLVIGQLMQEGAPMILGILPAYLDLKTMVNFYDPQSILLNLACAEMMAYYHLPHCGTSGSGTGWGPDLLAAETYWMNHLTACLARGGLAPFVGDTLTSKAFSPTNVIYVHEIIDQALRFSRGFALDEASLGLDEILQAGPGGNFLATRLTRQVYRQAYYPSPIFPRWSMEKWESQGRPAAGQVLREYALDQLAGLGAPEDYDLLREEGENFIHKRINQ
jgi:trimethylamine--corrinoid protein Co-methyltransferase